MTAYTSEDIASLVAQNERLSKELAYAEATIFRDAETIKELKDKYERDMEYERNQTESAEHDKAELEKLINLMNNDIAETTAKVKRLETDLERELRQTISYQPNGLYATEICEHCHNFLSSPNGSLETAIITSVCSQCWKDKVNKLTLKLEQYQEALQNILDTKLVVGLDEETRGEIYKIASEALKTKLTSSEQIKNEAKIKRLKTKAEHFEAVIRHLLTTKSAATVERYAEQFGIPVDKIGYNLIKRKK